jgi:hypothetical protein
MSPNPWSRAVLLLLIGVVLFWVTARKLTVNTDGYGISGLTLKTHANTTAHVHMQRTLQKCPPHSESGGCREQKGECKCTGRKWVTDLDMTGTTQSKKHLLSRTYCVAQCNSNVTNGCCPSGVLHSGNIHCIHGECGPNPGRTRQEGAALVTMGSIDRFVALEETMSRWSGPITVVVSLDNRKGQLIDAQRNLDHLRVRCQGWRLNVDVYAAVLPTLNVADPGVESIPATQFPFNALRNVAMDRAAAPWILYVDMDFIPTKTLYATLITTILPRARLLDKPALVLPHWELTLCKSILPQRGSATEQKYAALAQRTPIDFASLRVTVGRGDARPFLGRLKDFGLTPSVLVSADIPTNRSSDCSDAGRDTRATFPGGVMLTGYPAWLAASVQHRAGLLHIDQQFTMHRDKSLYGGLGTLWEPFLIVRADDPPPPRFAEVLIGRSRDRATWTIQLQAEKYTFYSILHEFLSHFPHDNLANTPKGRAGRGLQKHMNRRNTAVQRTLVAELERTYSGVPSPRGWGVDHGFVCNECECCGRFSSS